MDVRHYGLSHAFGARRQWGASKTSGKFAAKGKFPSPSPTTRACQPHDTDDTYTHIYTPPSKQRRRQQSPIIYGEAACQFFTRPLYYQQRGRQAQAGGGERRAGVGQDPGGGGAAGAVPVLVVVLVRVRRRRRDEEDVDGELLADLAVLADAAEVEALAGLGELDDGGPALVPVGDVVHAARVEQLPRRHLHDVVHPAPVQEHWYPNESTAGSSFVRSCMHWTHAARRRRGNRSKS